MTSVGTQVTVPLMCSAYPGSKAKRCVVVAVAGFGCTNIEEQPGTEGKMVVRGR